MKTDNETIDNAVRGDYLTDGDIIFISSGHPDPMKAVVGMNWLRNYIFFDEYCCLAVKENVRKATDAERISLDDVLRKQRLAWSQAEGKLKRTEQEASAVWPLISNCQPIIAGYGGTVTRMEDGDTRYDENFILRQHENGGWWIWQLVLPQFKVGDCIRAKGTNGEGSVIKAIDDEAGCYVFDHDVRGSYVCQEYELVPWEPRSGDIVRHKGDDDGRRFRISDNPEGYCGGGEFSIMQIMDCGIAGGSISRYSLKEDYELVERPHPFDEALYGLSQQLGDALKSSQKPVGKVEIIIDGERHCFIDIKDSDINESCAVCSLDKVCDRFKEALCNAIAGRDGGHLFQKEE